MESSECESADGTDAEQLATVHCTSAQLSGERNTPATVKADCLAADRLQKKHRRAELTTEERAARLQSYHSFLHNSFACEACLMRYVYVYLLWYVYTILGRT